jgi:hypothetical protein
MKKLNVKKLLSFVFQFVVFVSVFILILILRKNIHDGSIYPDPIPTSNWIFNLILALAVFIIFIIFMILLKKKNRLVRWFAFIILISFCVYKTLNYKKNLHQLAKVVLIKNDSFNKIDVDFFDRHNNVFMTDYSENPIYIVTTPLSIPEYKISTNNFIKRRQELLESGKAKSIAHEQSIKQSIDRLKQNNPFYEFLKSNELSWVKFQITDSNINIQSLNEKNTNAESYLDNLNGIISKIDNLQSSILKKQSSCIILLMPKTPSETIIESAKIEIKNLLKQKFLFNN